MRGGGRRSRRRRHIELRGAVTRTAWRVGLGWRRGVAAFVALATLAFGAVLFINAATVAAAPAPPGVCSGTGEAHGDCRSDFNHVQHCLDHPAPVAPFCASAPVPPQSSPPQSSPPQSSPPQEPPQASVPASNPASNPAARSAAVPGQAPPPGLTPSSEVQAAATATPTPTPTATPTPTPRPRRLSGGAPAPPRQSSTPLPPITTVITPLNVSTDVKLIGENLFIALLLAALLALPAELINGTLKDNYPVISAWMGFTKGKASALHQLLSHLPSHLSLALFVGIGAILYTFLDPSAGFNLTTAAELLGLIGALAVITASHDLARNEYINRRYHKHGRLVTFPAGIIFAIGLVIVSRVFNFEPGFIFGLMTGIAFSDTVPQKEDGKGLAIASLIVLVVAFAAWFIWIPVKANVDSTHNPAFIMILLDTLLATVWVAGIQSVVFSLIPIRFMDGKLVAGWSRLGWLGIYVFALFVFVHTVLHPRPDQVGTQSSPSVVYLSVLLGVLTVFAVSMWTFFLIYNKRHGEREERVPAEA